MLPLRAKRARAGLASFASHRKIFTAALLPCGHQARRYFSSVFVDFTETRNASISAALHNYHGPMLCHSLLRPHAYRFFALLEVRDKALDWLLVLRYRRAA